MEIVKIKGLSKSYNKQVVYDMANLNVSQKSGIVSFKGESGAGKSTLLNLILGYDQSYSGIIEVLGRNIKEMNAYEYTNYLAQEIGVVYQDYKLYERLTVLENLSFVAEESEIDKYLKLFKMSDLKDKKVNNISGGEKQRVAIIRAMLKNPKILILDEPTANLDDKTFNELLETLSFLKKDKLIIIFTHDDRLEKHTDVIYEIKDKKIEEIAHSKEEISQEKRVGTIEEEYSKAGRIESKFRPISSIKGMFKLIKEHKKNYITKIILMTIVVNIFVLIFSGITFLYLHKEVKFYNGLNEGIVILDFDNIKEPYEWKGEFYPNPPDKLYWSEEDVAEVEALEGVKEVQLMTTRMLREIDNDDLYLDQEIGPQNYPDTIKNKPSHLSGKSFNVTFQTIAEPINVIPYYKTANILDIKLLAGYYPEEDTNGILVPDLVADYLLEKKDYKTYDELVGTDVNLEVSSFFDKEAKKFKTYNISGVYNTNYEYYLEDTYIIYLPNYVRVETLNVQESDYERVKKDADMSEYGASIYESFEAYKKAYGTHESEMAVFLEAGYTSADVYDEIEALYPNQNQISRYEYEQNGYIQAYHKDVISVFVHTMIWVLFIGTLIMLLIQRGYYKSKKQDYAMLLSLGYRKNKLLVMLFLEVLLDIILVFVGTCILMFLISLIPFIHVRQVLGLLYIEVLLFVSLFINIVNIISMILNINYRKVSKHLK